MEAQKLATDIVKKLVNEGYTAYFAGGWVRDYAMGHPSSDIDIATDALPDKILDLFPRTILVGLAFGVVIVVMDGHQFEVATFRRDVEYVHGRRPEKIEYSDAKEDAVRRDFTINGMFYDPLEDAVHDFVGGMEDIQRGIIRAIGDPYERFTEDRLRMIRAIRFSARFGFPIEPETQEAIRENAPTLLPAVAMERIQQEFTKMAGAPNFDHAIVEMHRLELLPVIFPKLKGVHLNTIKEQVEPFGSFPKKCPMVLYLPELFPEANTGELVDLCNHLKLSNAERKLVEFFGDHRKMLFEERITQNIDWAYFYASPHAQICLEVAAARLSEEKRKPYFERHQQRRQNLERHIERIQAKTPLVNATLLHEEGIEPGILMGEFLRQAEAIAIKQDLHDAQEVIKQLKMLPEWPHV